jgi:hypothetical protein
LFEHLPSEGSADLLQHLFCDGTFRRADRRAELDSDVPAHPMCQTATSKKLSCEDQRGVRWLSAGQVLPRNERRAHVDLAIMCPDVVDRNESVMVDPCAINSALFSDTPKIDR